MRRKVVLAVAISAPAFACGALGVAWRAEHHRVLCYQKMADEGLVGADLPPIGPGGALT